ncbi:MAG: hypothetical protein PVG82_08595 [Chromatiales bacterium]|jgi:hypothetical protein
MNVIDNGEGHLLLEFGIEEADALAKAIRQHARHMSNGALELASLLSEARYRALNQFRQPPHAFDAQAPRAPSTEGRAG